MPWRCSFCRAVFVAVVFCWQASRAPAHDAAAQVASIESIDCAAIDCAEPTCDATCDDEVLLIDTRRLPNCPSDSTRDRLTIVRRREAGCWTRTSFDELVGDTARQTVVWVHGNRFSPADAREYGLRCYRQLAKRRSGDLPLRFVIWSWPSDKVVGPLRDAREKAARANAEGANVAWGVRRLAPSGPWGLIGYSYGGRVSTSALHRIARDDRAAAIGPARVILFAPALDNDWLLPGGRHGSALDQAERLVVLYNPRDLVLKRYRLLDPFRRPMALGYTGLASIARLGPWKDRYVQLRVDGRLGRGHSVREYLDRDWVMRLAARTVSPPPIIDESLEFALDDEAPAEELPALETPLPADPAPAP